MILPARLLSAAESDLASCAKFLQSESTELAIRFLDSFNATIDFLGQSSEVGGLCHFSNPLLDGIRVWTIIGFKNHLVFYRIQPTEVEVVRILHASRDLDAIFGTNNE